MDSLFATFMAYILCLLPISYLISALFGGSFTPNAWSEDNRVTFLVFVVVDIILALVFTFNQTL